MGEYSAWQGTPRYSGVTPMRGTRWLVLVAIAAILGGVGLTYRAQKKVLREQAPPQPAALPTELNSSAQHWHFTDTDLKTGRVIADIDAEDFRQLKDTDRLDLKNVTIQIPNKDDATNDVVKSAAAAFFSSDHHLYSEGEVEITLRVPKEGPPSRTLVSIKSSGVNFDSETYRAENRPSLDLHLPERRRPLHGRHLRPHHPRAANEKRRGGRLESARPQRQAHQD